VRLCAQCKAALKRVRYDTVSQLMPMPRRPRRGDRLRPIAHPVDAPERQAARRRGAVAWRGVRIPLALGAMVAIVGSAGYFIVHQIHAATPPDAAATAVGGAEDTPRLTPPPAIVESSAASPIVVPQAASGNDAAQPAVAKARNATRSVKTPPTAVGPPAPEGPPEPPPTPVVVAAAPPPPAPRPADRMQLLAQAFTECPQDALLTRMVCEQKARLQYCDGYWGQAALCPNGAPDRNNSH
jgi:hypothetical protein